MVELQILGFTNPSPISSPFHSTGFRRLISSPRYGREMNPCAMLAVSVNKVLGNFCSKVIPVSVGDKANRAWRDGHNPPAACTLRIVLRHVAHVSEWRCLYLWDLNSQALTIRTESLETISTVSAQVRKMEQWMSRRRCLEQHTQEGSERQT
jgi:hypothetical protein